MSLWIVNYVTASDVTTFDVTTILNCVITSEVTTSDVTAIINYATTSDITTSCRVAEDLQMATFKFSADVEGFNFPKSWHDDISLFTTSGFICSCLILSQFLQLNPNFPCHLFSTPINFSELSSSRLHFVQLWNPNPKWDCKSRRMGCSVQCNFGTRATRLKYFVELVG